MSNKSVIAISGKSGCGNTTVSSLVARELGFAMINYTFRSLAEDLGITFAELRRRAEEDDSYDRMLDTKQVALAREEDCVLGSRLAIWLLEEADLKVYLYASPEIRARRIMAREGRTLEETLQETMERDRMDSERYRRIYGIDNRDYQFADLIIDTDTCDQYTCARMIIEAFKAKTGRVDDNQ